MWRLPWTKNTSTRWWIEITAAKCRHWRISNPATENQTLIRWKIQLVYYNPSNQQHTEVLSASGYVRNFLSNGTWPLQLKTIFHSLVSRLGYIDHNFFTVPSQIHAMGLCLGGLLYKCCCTFTMQTLWAAIRETHSQFTSVIRSLTWYQYSSLVTIHQLHGETRRLSGHMGMKPLFHEYELLEWPIGGAENILW